MSKNLVLVGGGGHCKSVIDVAECAGYSILGILDRPEELGKCVLGYEVIGTDDDMAKYVDKAEFIVTVGQIESPELRVKLHKMIENVGGKMTTIISPTAHVSKHASIGEGTVVMHHAVVNANAKIGKGCIINTFANIEHDVVVGDYCHVSTGAMINGGVVIADRTFVGSRAIVNQGVRFTQGTSYTVVGAGACVLNDVPADCTVVGMPAKVVKYNH